MNEKAKPGGSGKLLEVAALEKLIYIVLLVELLTVTVLLAVAKLTVCAEPLMLTFSEVLLANEVDVVPAGSGLVLLIALPFASVIRTHCCAIAELGSANASAASKRSVFGVLCI